MYLIVEGDTPLNLELCLSNCRELRTSCSPLSHSFYGQFACHLFPGAFFVAAVLSTIEHFTFSVTNYFSRKINDRVSALTFADCFVIVSRHIFPTRPRNMPHCFLQRMLSPVHRQTSSFLFCCYCCIGCIESDCFSKTTFLLTICNLFLLNERNLLLPNNSYQCGSSVLELSFVGQSSLLLYI